MARYIKKSREPISWSLKPIPDRSNKELDLTIKWCDEHLEWLDIKSTGHRGHIDTIKGYKAQALTERTKRFYNK